MKETATIETFDTICDLLLKSLALKKGSRFTTRSSVSEKSNLLCYVRKCLDDLLGNKSHPEAQYMRETTELEGK